jgi:Mg-chelatase subunit ChlD
MAVKGPTDDDGGTVDAEGLPQSVDPEAAQMAREIVLRLRRLRPPRTSASGPRGGPLKTHPYQHDAADLDLDRTLESLLGEPVPSEEHIHVRERARARQSVVLLADVSGSMKGDKVRTMAATVAALAAHLRSDQLAVLAFWSEAAWISRYGQQRTALTILDSLLSLPAQGLTNVAFPLTEASRVVRRAPSGSTRVLLLSDCVHNAGPDPRRIASGIPRLDVLMDTSGEHDGEMASELARLGNGRMRPVRSHRDVSAALNDLMRT